MCMCYCNIFIYCSDVAQTGFCTQFCGWHDNYGNYKYAWIGIPPSGCNCFAQLTSHNGNAGVDAAVSTIAHELAETVTDPLGTGWYNSNGDENGDVCAWNFLTTTYTSGYSYNMVVGGKKYLVQSLPKFSTMTCAMS